MTGNAEQLRIADAAIRAVRDYAQEWAGNGFAADLLALIEPALIAQSTRPRIVELTAADIATRRRALHLLVGGRSLDELQAQDHRYQLSQEEQSVLRRLEDLDYLSGAVG